MVALRIWPKGRIIAPFGLCALGFAVMPAQIGYQDLGSLIARKAAAAEYRQPMLASPFGTIHPATYSFPQPIGTAIPTSLRYQLVNFNPRDFDGPGSLSGAAASAGAAPPPPIVYPRVERRGKGDMLVSPTAIPDQTIQRGGVQPTVSAEGQAAGSGTLLSEDEPVVSIATEPEIFDIGLADLAVPDGMRTDDAAGGSGDLEAAPERVASLYFGLDPIGPPLGGLEPWTTDPDRPADVAPTKDLDIKRSALKPDAGAATSHAAKPEAGETVAGKGEVTGKGKRPRSPAERLGLAGKARAKAERCLANAVYFEARGEPVRGQIAVAQVVMNRVFSNFYPDNVCGVVYQGAHRHLACQFTFACDGIPDVVTEPEAWVRAKKIAKDTLDGKLWLNEIGKATHYHAYWVRPSWVHEMKKMYKLGVHTFYRPRAWGNGADEPIWGSAKLTAEEAKRL